MCNLSWRAHSSLEKDNSPSDWAVWSIGLRSKNKNPTLKTLFRSTSFRSFRPRGIIGTFLTALKQKQLTATEALVIRRDFTTGCCIFSWDNRLQLKCGQTDQNTLIRACSHCYSGTVIRHKFVPVQLCRHIGTRSH